MEYGQLVFRGEFEEITQKTDSCKILCVSADCDEKVLVHDGSRL